MTNGNNFEPARTAAEPPARPGSRARGASTIKAVQRALGGFVLVALVLGAYLYFYSSHQRTYLTGRDHRALGSMSALLGAKLQAVDQLLRSVGKIRRASTLDSAAVFIPAYQHLVLRDSREVIYPSSNVGRCGKTPVDTPATDGKWRLVAHAAPFCLYRSFEIAKGDTGTAYLNAATFFKGDFQTRVFDKALVADVSGQVLLEAGSPEIVLTRLDPMVQGREADSTANWSRLSLGSSIGRVTLSGIEYRLFLEPCCRLADGSLSDPPLLVAGLVDNGRFVRDTFRISLSWVTILCCALILMLLAWPFLKFRLMGDRQPVRLADGLHLGLSSFLAAALIAIFLLDLYAYTKQRAADDAALSRLSVDIATHFREEIDSARTELDRLYAEAKTNGETVKPPERRTIRKDHSKRYPFFESWSLVDSAGRQVRKWSTDAYVQDTILVKDRAYFREITQGRGWARPRSGLASVSDSTYYLESTVSRTTGKRQTALSIRVPDTGRPVASMALELLSLIGVVLPPGYGFAVLNDSGRVLFHSDPTRNLSESFFSEADDDPRLRSAVLARAADTLNLRYGGFDHRAHVAPLRDVPWSLVTFLDKDARRITNAESLLSGVFLLLVYTIALAIVGILVLVFLPDYRVPWLWPDRRRYSAYVRIAVINGLFLTASVVEFLALERDDLLSAGLLLPVAAILANWAALTRRGAGALGWAPRVAVPLWAAVLGIGLLRSEIAGWPHYTVYVLAFAGSCLALLPPPNERQVATAITRVYLTAAVLFILIVGAMPAAAFFKVASAAHTEMLIKGSQLDLARQLEHRVDSIRLAYTDALGLGKSNMLAKRLCTCAWDLYHNFFFGTDTSTTRADSLSPTASANLVGLFLTPYRPRASVPWRGTHGPGAQDETWTWARSGDTLVFRGSPTPGRPPLALHSIPSDLVPDRVEELLTAALLLGLLLLAVWAIAAFVARRFFLIDVTDPVIVSRGRRIESVGGTNLFVVCRDAKEEEAIKVPRAGKRFDLRTSLRQNGDLRWVVRSVSEGDLVLLKHFEYQRGDEATTRAKVDLLDTLVHEYNCNVVILSGQHRDGSPLGLRAAWRLIEATAQQHSGAAQALESLVVVDAGRWMSCPRRGERRRPPAPVASSTVDSVIVQERRCDRHLHHIWRGLESSLRQPSQRLAKQGREELLDLMGERAEPYYREIWESCRPAERSVLVHLADSGLVNHKDRRILRRLLARGLIRREPNFVLMNETFRRFVQARTAEVEAELPPQPGTWDAIRRPVMAAGTGLVILLLVSQQELLGATTATLTALGTGIATLSKITGLFDRRGPGKASG